MKIENWKLKINGGFTLVEVLVSIGLLGVTIFMCKSLLDIAPAAKSVSHEDIALKIAGQEIEELRALGYSAVPSSGPFSDLALSSLPSGSASITISDYDSKTKKAVVAVSWVETSSGNRSVSLTTLLAKIGGIK